MAVLIARPSPKLGAWLSWALLMIGGLLAAVVMVALFETLRDVDLSVALLALVFAIIGAFGSTIHGGYEVANLGTVTGIAMIVVYLGRLIILSPANPVVLLAAGVTGFILAPAWYIWLGLTLGDHAIDGTAEF